MSNIKFVAGVKVAMLMEEGPLPGLIAQVLEGTDNVTPHTFVRSVDDADLVIFTDLRKVPKVPSGATRAYLELSCDNDHPLPEDCLEIDPIDPYDDLVAAINRA